jgi:hypothetical protein
MNEANDARAEVQDLVWALIDEQATERQVRHLEGLLLASYEARLTYVMCMQMHADLCYQLSGKQRRLPFPIGPAKKLKSAGKSAPGLPTVDLPATVTDMPFSERR